MSKKVLEVRNKIQIQNKKKQGHKVKMDKKCEIVNYVKVKSVNSNDRCPTKKIEGANCSNLSSS